MLPGRVHILVPKDFVEPPNITTAHHVLDPHGPPEVVGGDHLDRKLLFFLGLVPLLNTAIYGVRQYLVLNVGGL